MARSKKCSYKSCKRMFRKQKTHDAHYRKEHAKPESYDYRG